MAPGRRLAAIMFTDLEGFTTAAQKDEAGALRLLREQEALIGPILANHRGRRVKSMGDGLLLEFANALDAVECSVDLQRALHEHNSRESTRTLRVRIGIHLGDVQDQGDDILGDAVNIASRIEPLAEPEGVCLSAQVYDQVHNKVPYQLMSLGKRTLKGIRDPVEVYRVALPWLGLLKGVPTSTVPRLAILPLANISPEPKDEYFADGLTEELTAVCSQIRGLRVIGRTSVAQYRGSTKSIAQIGEELAVDSVLEGSVRKAGNRIRVTLQLIDVASQEHTWSANFDREVDDVFAIQAEVARQTARVLHADLLESDQSALRRKPTSSIEAYELYLQAVHSLDAMTDSTEGEAIDEAIRSLEHAIRIDPTFSLAHSYLADLLSGGAQAGEYSLPKKGNRRAYELVNRALELDPDSSSAHLSRANFALYAERDWPRAEAEFRTALELNPSNHRAHGNYGYLLVMLQRFEEAKEEFRLAFELDPSDYPHLAWQSMAHFRLGQVDTALTLIRRTRDAVTTFRWPHVVIGWYLAGVGRLEEARREADLSTGPLIRWLQAVRATLYARVGSSDEAIRLLREWEASSKATYTPASWLAGLHAVVGEKETALRILEGDCREGSRTLAVDYHWEYFDSVRDDPRFVALLRELNLPTEVTWWQFRGPAGT